MRIRLTYVRLSIHSTHCHDGAFFEALNSVLTNFVSAHIEWQYVLSIPTVHFESKNRTLR